MSRFVLFTLSTDDFEVYENEDEPNVSAAFIAALKADTPEGEYLRLKVGDMFCTWSHWDEFVTEAESLAAPYLKETK